MGKPENDKPADTDGHVRNTLWHPSWHGRRKAFLIPKLMMGVIIIIAFLFIMSNFFGSAFHQQGRIKALNILAVDYDTNGSSSNGTLGEAFSAAYHSLRADSFPTIDFRSASEFPDAQSIRHAVCRGDYWAGTYIHADASSRLALALGGNTQSLSLYNASDVFTYIYNQARYPTVADSELLGGIQSWVAMARASYYESQSAAGFSGLAAALNLSDATAAAAAVEAFLNPIVATADLIQPTVQGSRVYYNSAYVVPPILAPFFLILAMNGISGQHNVFTHAYVRDVFVLRFVIGKIYTFLAALAFAGYLWAFRESWDVDGRQFVLTWMVMWLNCEVNWVIMESLVASFVPLAFVSVFVVSWVMVNVASAIYPFEMSPGWYRWGYMLPGHETYATLIHVWSGCTSPLRYALPVMFSWWVVGHVVAWFSVRKRCIDAEKELKLQNQSGEDTA